MKGLFFAFIENRPQGLNVRTGVVKEQVGTERWLLEFTGQNYRFSNVVSAEHLEKFAFFATLDERQAFLADLAQQHMPPLPPPEVPAVDLSAGDIA